MVSSSLADAFSARGHEVIRADLFRVCGVPSAVPDLVYRFSASFLKRRYSRTYTRLLRDEALREKLRQRFTPDWMLAPLKRYLQRLRPDCVIATHVFAAMLVGDLKASGQLSFPLAAILTDYCVHPFWECCLCLDALVLPSPLLCDAAAERGISPDILVPLGLPLRRDFASPPEPAAVRSELGLPALPLVLLMGGSMGYGRLFGTALALRKQQGIHTVCVCGRNRLLHALLRPFRSGSLTVLGYVPGLARYIRAADLAVTKPGGITLTELSVFSVPALLFDPIPGHEERNLAFWTAHGGCLDGSGLSCREIAASVREIVTDQAEIFNMKSAQSRLSFPQAAENLCKFVESLDKTEKHDTI